MSPSSSPFVRRVRAAAASVLLVSCAHAGAAPALAATPASAAASSPAAAQATAPGSLPAAVRIDSIAQRALACTGCHGVQGRAAADGFYPRIAGKPAGYLYHQLQNFRDGRRHYPLMTHLVEHLTDPFLLELATYFADLDLPYPAAAARPAGAVAARGEVLVREGDQARAIPACVQCHGASMTGVAPAIPGLLGLPRDYLNAQLGAWRNGQRHAHAPDCMRDIATRLAPEDIDAVSSWLAAQPVPVPSKASDRLPAPLPQPCGGVSDGGRP